jgi:hypothetical protein
VSVAILEMQLEAARQTEALGLLDAVRTIAQSGDKRSKTEWIKEWNKLRFLYGERHGDRGRPYAEVGALVYQSEYMVHEPGQKPNAPDAVTRVDVVYSRLDCGATDCFLSGFWTDDVLAEAQRLKACPPSSEPQDAAQLEEAKSRFSSVRTPTEV